MRHFLLALPFILIPESAFSFGAINCGGPVGGVECFATSNYSSEPNATTDAYVACTQHFSSKYCAHGPTLFSNTCIAAAVTPNGEDVRVAPTLLLARQLAKEACDLPNKARPCVVALAVCDGTSDPSPIPNSLTTSLQTPTTATSVTLSQTPLSLLNLGAVGTGISFGIGLIVALLIYASRAPIINFIIHGNLPYKLPAYGEDIQCLFKRTQRVNWYGRVVFGIVANLTMTQQQLVDVRKYWLGRVIAFDSLRRQRQNQLARMHLQLAASVKSEAKDKKPLSQLLAALKTLLFMVFYLIRAVFSFFFGFLFIRITIAKLVRGTVIESKDLVLILQAKDAIEQSTTYLKEYLTTANTFDGGDEIYEPK